MGVRRVSSALVAIAGMLLLTGADTPNDPNNPTCPAEPNWGPDKPMTLTPVDRNGMRVLLAEGRVDAELPARLAEAIEADPQIAEIWFRSRGGNAIAGNDAGRVIRAYPGLATRIPEGWACFSSCNFIFMGGQPRFVDEGGIFMVHMFTHTSDRWVINDAVVDGTEATTELIAEIEQSSALLASKDNDFLIRMGISRKLLTQIMYRQQAVGNDFDPSTRYCLTQDELREYNVVNTPG